MRDSSIRIVLERIADYIDKQTVLATQSPGSAKPGIELVSGAIRSVLREEMKVTPVTNEE